MDGLLTDLEATVGTYQLRYNDDEQQDRQGDRAANRCPEGSTLTGHREPTSFAPMAASI